MYCRNCGKLLRNDENFCTSCGFKVVKVVEVKKEIPKVKEVIVKSKEETPKDKVNVGWWFLGFFIPVVGIILFFVYKKKKSKVCDNLIYGSISGFIIGFTGIAITFIVLLSLYYGPIEKGVYSFNESTLEDNSKYEITSELRLEDFDYGYGEFTISTNEVYSYYGDYIELYEGEVEVEIVTTRVGEWTMIESGDVELVTFEKVIVCKFSGEGKDGYIKSIKPDCELVYGFSFTKKILSSQDLVYNYKDGETTFAVLNDNNMSYIEYNEY